MSRIAFHRQNQCTARPEDSPYPPIENAKLLSTRKRADPRARPTIARPKVGRIVPDEPDYVPV